MSNQDQITSMYANGHVAIISRLDEVLKKGRAQLSQSNLFFNQQKESDGVSYLMTDSLIGMVEESKPSDGHGDEISNLNTALHVGSVIFDSVPLRPTDGSDGRSSPSDSSGVCGRPQGARSTPWSSPTLVCSELQQKTVIAAEDGRVKDPTPYFDDTTPREVLKALIARLRNQVKLDYDQGHLRQAKQSLQDTILHLEELYICYGEPFTDFAEMQELLAKIYRKLGKIEEATKIIIASLQHKSKPGETSVVKAPTMMDAGVIPDQAKMYLELGQIRHETYRSRQEPLYLDAAERDAKRAFKCSLASRETQNESFVSAVFLLIKIYEDKGKFVHADTYRDLFLQNSKDLSASPRHSLEVTPSGRSHDSLTLPIIHISRGDSREPSDLVDMIKSDWFENTMDQPLGLDLELCRDGKTAMMHAVEKGDVHAIRKLRHAGAQLDQGLLHAVRKGNADMTQLLLELDAPKEVKDCHGATPLLVAAKGGHVSVMQQLLEMRADVDAKDNEGWSIIHCAAHQGSAAMMRALLKPDYRINKNAVCPAGKTALHYLAEKDDAGIANLLLQQNADPEIKDTANRTPFELAVLRRRYDFVVMLLENNVTFDRASLPPTSQEIRNLLGLDERASFSSSSITLVSHHGDQVRQPEKTIRSSQMSRLGRLRLPSLFSSRASLSSK